jgi:hypothetical protein
MKRSIVRIGLGIVMGGLLCGGLMANPARASVVTFNFTGNVTNVVGTFTGSGISSGSPFTASYQFDTSALPADSNPTPSIGQYFNALNNVTFSLGTYSNIPQPSITVNSVTVIDGSADAYSVRAPVIGLAPGSSSLLPTELKIDLLGGTAGITSEAFPTIAPSISSFTSQTFRVLFNGGALAGGVTVVGNLSSLTAVPLPAAVILFGAGLIALVGLGAGSWRKRNNSLA